MTSRVTDIIKYRLNPSLASRQISSRRGRFIASGLGENCGPARNRWKLNALVPVNTLCPVDVYYNAVNFRLFPLLRIPWPSNTSRSEFHLFNFAIGFFNSYLKRRGHKSIQFERNPNGFGGFLIWGNSFDRSCFQWDQMF